MLNPSKGNMYPWVTHTWNAIKGACPHDCEYCYMKRWGTLKPFRLDKKELRQDLGAGGFIFVGSSCDMWAEDIPDEWILKVLAHCTAHATNRYLFQTKNPGRLLKLKKQIPEDSFLATTIETNRAYPQMGRAPAPIMRAQAMMQLRKEGFETVVTIEPIMDFDLEKLRFLVYVCEPKWVNIGANTSKDVVLPEPGWDKIRALVKALEKFTEVKVKSNLERLKAGGKEEG